MKALLLTAAMLLTAVIAPRASADKLIPLNGSLTGNEVSQFTNGKIVLDGVLSGKSSVGDVTYTYHAELDPVHLTAVQSGQLLFANGDAVNLEGFGLSVSSGLTKDGSALTTATELLHFTSGNGRFATGLGNLVVQRTQSIAIANYARTSETFGSFQGYYMTGGGKGASDATTSGEGKITLDPDESVVQICDNGRERAVRGGRVDEYLKKHPGSYVGPCDSAGGLEGNALTSEDGKESSSLDPDESVVQICDNGRERAVRGGRVNDYLNRHPGSYLGPCDGSQF